MTDRADDAASQARLVRETVYGSRKRLAWVLGQTAKSDTLLEVGCGTGYMLCRPLAKLGYRVEGIDLDATSIERGQQLLRAEGLDPGILSCRPLRAVTSRPSVIIVSEVLEHLHDEELSALLAEVRSHLDPGGRLLVTVPNGYGWFEMEQFLWWKLGIGQVALPVWLLPSHRKDQDRATWVPKPSTLDPRRRSRAHRTCSVSRWRRSRVG